MILPPTYRHSASAGNRFREAPDSFIWRYVLNKPETFGPKAAIGSAIEFAIADWLLGAFDHAEDHSIRVAQDEYLKRAQGEVDPVQADIPALVVQARQAFRPFGIPLSYQASHKLAAGERFGLRYPVLAYTDFGYEDCHIDCKVTWALPSKPRFDHVAQLGVYWRLTGKAQTIAYITPKKHAVYEVPEADLEHGWRTMFATWKRIEALDQMCRAPADALSIIPLNLDSFRWNGVNAQEVMATWQV